VLVSGAGGFIGRWSVPALLRLGYEVHAVLSGAASRDVPELLQGAKIHFKDLLHASHADALMNEVRPSHLLHFAWIATPGVYWTSAENFRWLAASEHLLRSFHAHGGSRVMMAGSCAEYDWSRVGVCDELSSPLADDRAAQRSPRLPMLPAKSLCKEYWPTSGTKSICPRFGGAFSSSLARTNIRIVWCRP
jgi:nucleoside-diphosphate-sugar epimerase